MFAAIVVSLWGLVALLVLVFQIKSSKQVEIKDLKRAEEIHVNAEKSRSEPLPSDPDAGLRSIGKLRD